MGHGAWLWLFRKGVLAVLVCARKGSGVDLRPWGQPGQLHRRARVVFDVGVPTRCTVGAGVRLEVNLPPHAGVCHCGLGRRFIRAYKGAGTRWWRLRHQHDDGV